MTRRGLSLAITWSLLLALCLPGAAALAQETPTAAEQGTAAGLLSSPVAAPGDSAAAPSQVIFLHVATASNTSTYITTIDHPATNGKPSALLFVTHYWNPGGVVGGTYNDHALGVWYNDGKWKIYNQDFAPMPAGAAFNVLVVLSGSEAFVHTAAAGNIVGNSTVINNALTNGQPNKLLLVTPNFNAGPQYNPHPINVYYDGSGRWVIGNQNGATMPVGSAYNVLVLDPGPSAFVHRTTTSNRISNYTLLDNPLTNGRPNRLVFITQNWNPGGTGGTYNAKHVGIWYSHLYGKMSIYNEDETTPIPVNAAFNVYVPTPDAGAFVHRAATGNTAGHVTTIDHPLTNDNLYAPVFITPNWNPGGAGGTYHNHPIGVYHSSGRWRIFNQNLAAMPINAAFNVLVDSAGANVFIHKASSGNISGHVTTIDHPLTNDNANARLLVTQNWNPDGGSGVYNDHAIGVYYGGGRWRIFNQDLAAMPVGAAFNVMVLPDGPDNFVHTATAANINNHITYMSHPLTTSNRHALVFITSNWNPGGSGGTYNNRHTGVFYSALQQRWAVFNQDLAAMPVNAGFNVYVVGSKTHLPLVNR
ncbi:MAG: hypothetical protein NZ528_03840 [Caldilineales bacterium]|nr:hypothetical protein [Caldilineales bacterium]MDW8318643.1 hypothetical protein [Anaerolineae bacterium]